MKHNRPKIKICCIKSREELATVVKYGVDCVGFVSKMPSGPGIISDREIRDIAKYAPEHVDTFLLTSHLDPKKIIEQQQFCKTKTVQLCNPLKINDLKKLKEALVGVKIVGVTHVLNEESIQKAVELQDFVDAILLDTGNPCGASPELGGTGRTHNWDVSKKICQHVTSPVYLAGGLNHKNVIAAIEHVDPYGIDLCCGVRTNDKLDEKKLQLLLGAIEDYFHKNTE
ncbi:MAG: phosphoribosylanthranilate isomerase [Candidatus Jorgensenbacteria bacterium]